MKRFSLVFCLVLALSLVFVGSAFANFGPHGGYATDTDSCAGCHRAHTSFSTVEFEPKRSWVPEATSNALLVGSASTMLEFCYACHGDAAPGASTNVQSGVFDAAASTAGVAAATGDASRTRPRRRSTRRSTAAVSPRPRRTGIGRRPLPPVYAAVTSSHSMEQTSVLWGAGNGVEPVHVPDLHELPRSAR